MAYRVKKFLKYFFIIQMFIVLLTIAIKRNGSKFLASENEEILKIRNVKDLHNSTGHRLFHDTSVGENNFQIEPMEIDSTKRRDNKTELSQNKVEQNKNYETITDFKFLVNNSSLCSSASDLFYLIYVHSTPTNIRRRQLIRQTWGQINLFQQYPSR